jgi:hypothetical protein
LTTVDLIFRNGIDWKAFVLSFNAVQAKNEGTELSLQSIANKGDGNVDVKAIADSKTMNENRKTEIGSINLGDGATLGSVTGDNTGTFTGNQTINKSEPRQTLAEAAEEIKKLLKQLEQSNPTPTEVEQKAFLTAAIPSTNKQRFVNALQAGGKELFKELMDNMYVNVAVAAMEGWQSAE